MDIVATVKNIHALYYFLKSWQKKASEPQKTSDEPVIELLKKIEKQLEKIRENLAIDKNVDIDNLPTIIERSEKELQEMSAETLTEVETAFQSALTEAEYKFNNTLYQISGYKIEQKIGGGGMGIVYKAKNLKSGADVAIKFISPRMVTDGVFERFEREAHTLKAIKNPHVIEFYEFIDKDSIVMEYMPDGSLNEKMFNNNGSLKVWAVDEVLDFMLQISSGLKAIHEQQLMHRDIKPLNILLKNKCFKISDFGSIKTQNSVLTMPQKTPITMLYAPTELWNDEDSHTIFDYSCDIYSLGLICYKMLTGQHPFKSPFDCCTGTYTPIRSIKADVPVTMAAIVEKMMHVTRTMRYPSAVELNDALKDLKERWVTIYTQDPLVELTEILNKKTYDRFGKHQNDCLWPQEHLIEKPSREEIELVSKISVLCKTNAAMAVSRREMSEKLLLKFYLFCGNWSEALKLAKRWYPDHLSTKYIAVLSNRSRKINIEKYKTLRQPLCKAIWPESNFFCRRTKKTFSADAMAQKKAFFIRNDVVDRDLLIRKATKKLFDYKVLPSIEKDVLGEYSLAFDNTTEETFVVHALPFERKKLSANAQEIIERYKRGISHTRQMKDAPCIMSQGNANPLEDDQYTYFILEYKLTRRLPFLITKQEQTGASPEKVFVLLEMARGLEVLYACSAVHRYLSPLRIEIDILGNVYIGGFSFAKLTEGNINEDWVSISMADELKKTGGRLGNPYFMSPEEFTIGLQESSHQSDIWSFGAIAYKLLSGKNVFDVGIYDIAKFRASNPQIIPLKEYMPNISEELARIIEKCLEVDTKKRYPNASILLNDLLGYVASSY